MSTDTTALRTSPLRSPTRYFWLHLLTLGVGVGLLTLAPLVAARLDDSGWLASTAVMVTVVVALATVIRSTYVIVTSAFSDAHRVFRSRHLFACSVLLFGVAVLLAGAMLMQQPFDELFAHGTLTGEEVVDLAIMVTAIVCGVGSGVAVTGAWDCRHDERHWHLALDRRSRPTT